MRPLVLDFDDSVLPVAAGEKNELRLNLGNWQEAIRFGCTWKDFQRLEAHLAAIMPQDAGCVFCGSGDYHHISLLLLRRLQALPDAQPESLDVVVLDNHPDNMRYLFGLHCGSWVRHACALPVVRRVHVVGITSDDISAAHAWENYLTPFLRRKLEYWSVGARADWLGLVGRKDSAHCFASPQTLLDAFLPLVSQSGRIYLSIDKDVFSQNEVRTNWDQGVFDFSQAGRIIAACKGKLAGADICGDVSSYVYSGAFKRFLSRLDGQDEHAPDAAELVNWQKQQQSMNTKLLAALQSAVT